MNRKRRSGGGLYLGRVSFIGFGGFQEKFVSDILADGISLRKAEISQGEIRGEVSPTDYLSVAKAALKNGVRLRAGERRGVYFMLARYSNRLGLYIGVLAFILILSFHSSRVESIIIEGAPREQVLAILSECGIEKGVQKNNLATDRAEYLIMTRLDNTAWVDVSCIGNRVSVHIEQGKEQPEIEDNSSPRNLVASRDAVIVEQIVRKGKSLLTKGSGVQMGGLLVGGVVADGGENVLYVRADAEVIGEFYEQQEFYVPFNETIKRADGEQTEYKSLVFYDDEYPLYLKKTPPADAICSEETSLVRFFGEVTPFKLRTVTYTEYRSIDITRTSNDAVSELRRLKQSCEETFYSDYEIVSAVEQFYPEEDGIRLIVDYTLRGNIAQPQAIELAAAAN